MSPYIDTGWTGTPADLAAGLAKFGFTVSPAGKISVTDPSKTGRIAALTSYRVLDGAAYVLVRSTQAVSPPVGITITGTQLTQAVLGLFMPGPDTITVPNPVDTTFSGTNSPWQSSTA